MTLGKTLRNLFAASLVAAALGASLGAAAAGKPRIEREADIPRFSYTIKEPLLSVVRDKALFDAATAPIRADISSVLLGYEIADKAAQRQMMLTLVQLDFLAGNYDAALPGAEAVRALEDKPADKLLSGLRLRAMATAARETGGVNTPAYTAAVARIIRKEIDGYPFAVIANDIRSYKASAETIGEGRILGSVKDVLQATMDKTGSLSSDLAPSLINARYALETLLPLKQTLTDTYTAYLKANEVAKADIWANRNVTLPAKGGYTPVRVAVWDSGVDTALFPKQLLKDAKGKTALLAFDLYSRPSNTELFPIPNAVQPRLPTLLARTKGFSDLQSNIDSPEASAVKQFMSTLKPEEFKPTLEELGLAGNYVHGTHVAGIVTAGNPWVQLAIARISFDYKLTPDPCPSRELSERSARANHAWVDWFKKNRIRVVNMSWGGTAKGNEDALERCGIGKTPEERQKLAREYFDIEKNALYTAFASAPDVLFITAAGNSNSDASFDEAIPSSLSLPNLLTVGAVDQAGDEAPFTSYGPTVVVHANGYQVESYLPGGKRVALSGTSMASPNVANLAAKMLAKKPSLKPAEVIAIIRATADKTSDGRRTLINPQKAMAQLH